MNAAPKVSVIIPVYNTERYLWECLDSVVNQTLRDIEIICVDDSSTDGSLQILKEYEAKDRRIKVLSQERSNAGTARNNGLAKATGEYLSFLDSDDFFELTMLEHMYDCAKSRNADMVICEMKLYYEDSGEFVPVNWHIRKELLPAKTVFSFCDIKKNAFRCNVSFVWDKLIKRDVVIKNHLYFQSQPVFNDTVFVYSTMMSAERITVLDEHLVYNRKRLAKDSITDTRNFHIDCAHSVLCGLKEYMMSKGAYERYKRDFICYAISLMHHTWLGGKNDPAIEKEIRNKVDLWLNEFAIKGHEPYYYYELSMYQKLLHEIQTQSADAESVRLQQEMNRLNNSLSYRVICYFKVNGLRCTLHRAAEKINEK